jgi:drug/metabolite transporter (DMT)-like permease
VGLSDVVHGAEAAAPNDYRRAVLFMALAAVFLPLLNAAIQYLAPAYPVGQLLWVRYAGHLAFMVIVFAPARGAALLASSRPGLQVARSALFCASTFLTFYALGFVPLATATAILFTSPLIVTALAPLLLRETVDRASALAVLAGFVGALIVARPGSGALHSSAFLILGSAAASAMTQILSRKVAGHDRPETTNTYMVLVGFVLASLALPFVWRWPADPWDAVLLASLGIFGGLGHYCLVRAFELAPAPFVSPFNYVQILGAALLGFLVFGQVPDLWLWGGAAIIAGSGVFILLHEQRRWRRP